MQKGVSNSRSGYFFSEKVLLTNEKIFLIEYFMFCKIFGFQEFAILMARYSALTKYLGLPVGWYERFYSHNNGILKGLGIAITIVTKPFIMVYLMHDNNILKVYFMQILLMVYLMHDNNNLKLYFMQIL